MIDIKNRSITGVAIMYLQNKINDKHLLKLEPAKLLKVCIKIKELQQRMDDIHSR